MRSSSKSPTSQSDSSCMKDRDGEDRQKNNRRWENVLRQMMPPKDYWTVPGENIGVASAPEEQKGRLDAETIEESLARISQIWGAQALRPKWPEGGPGKADSGRNTPKTHRAQDRT